MNTGVYVHIPFCRSKCPYCDFFSLVADEDMISKAVNSLNKEIGLYARDRDFKVQTVYFGGGTPTVLSVYQIEMLVSSVFNSFDCSYLEEMTIECNPETADPKKLSQLRRTGFDRISIGFQSLNDSTLSLLGREHDARTAINSFRAAADAGFENIGVDLMYGIPGESTQDFLRSLEGAVSLEPRSISLYHLTSKSGTGLSKLIANNLIRMPSDKLVCEQYYSASRILDAHGYACYEVSNFARAGFECRHNLNYWRRRPYFGFGPSACSFTDRTRRKNFADLKVYNDAISKGLLPIEHEEDLSEREIIFEEVYLALRTAQGLDLSLLGNEPMIDIKELNSTISYLSENGYINLSGGRIAVNNKFRLLTDGLALEILDSIKS
ncbi:MAG: radical SAM family heme chaperone HemW [Actinobacteria bacterium]|nr:radical SAM family heme chaperone HemW [Actinomycetota bacterium]